MFTPVTAIAVATLAVSSFTTTPPDPICVSRGGCAWEPNAYYVGKGAPHWTWMHEAGHLFDYSRMNDGARHRFESIMRMRPDRPWRDAPNSPHEQFAEAFALCSTSNTLPDNYNLGYGYAPSPRQDRAVCRLIMHVQAGA